MTNPCACCYFYFYCNARLEMNCSQKIMFEIPENLEPGKYQLLIAGAKDYEAFLRQYSSYKFIAENFDSLTEALNHLLNINRDRLYCILVFRPDGVTMQRAELPALPDTKGLILQSPKRTLQAQPYMHWLEKSFNTGTIVIDKQTMNIMFGEPANAITKNAPVVALGFTPLLFAALVPYVTVGVFLASIMAISALVTLILLPAVLTIIKRGKHD